MDTNTLKTPVVMFVFNRPETTRAVFNVIASVRPNRLFLIADGPRPGHVSDARSCSEVREIVSHVSWPCDTQVCFSKANLGCQQRIISGIDWVFSHVEDAIFLEDDCLPDPSFFFFCQELLELYRGDTRISAISGSNLVEKYSTVDTSYFFSRLGGNWGWATWKSSWQHYDRYLTDWPDLKRTSMLAEIFPEPATVNYWTRIFDDMYAHRGRNAWDYQWLYTHLKDNTVTAVPRLNLVQNIGFGKGATHTSERDRRFPEMAQVMQFPLSHPKSTIPLRSIDGEFQKLFRTPMHDRLLRKIRSIRNTLRTQPPE